MDKFKLIRIKSIYSLKHTFKESKDKLKLLRKYLWNKYLTKNLRSKCIKDSQDLIIRKKPTNKMCKTLNRHFIKEDMQMENKRMKRNSIPLVIRECKLKSFLTH